MKKGLIVFALSFFSALFLLAITLEKRVYRLISDFSQRGGRDDVWRMT